MIKQSLKKFTIHTHCQSPSWAYHSFFVHSELLIITISIIFVLIQFPRQYRKCHRAQRPP